jgi:hypothetical protein
MSPSLPDSTPPQYCGKCGLTYVFNKPEDK